MKALWIQLAVNVGRPGAVIIRPEQDVGVTPALIEVGDAAFTNCENSAARLSAWSWPKGYHHLTAAHLQ